MAVVKISDLPSATLPLTGAELTPIVQGGTTKKAPVSAVGSGGGGANVKSYGAVGDGVTDDSAAIQACVNANCSVFFPSGTYKVVTPIIIPANKLLYGEGACSTILYTGTVVSQGAFFVKSSSASTYVDNITVQDLRFLGQVATLGFSEFIHLIAFNGVRNCLIQRCFVEGFRGDGIIFGSGDIGGEERHNINCTVQDCFIDGINKDNRNGISVIDGQGITLQNNYFTRVSRSNMPGAIDIEPDAATFHIIRDISILNNRFFDIGGGVGCVSVYLPGVTYTTAPYGFNITGNFIEDLDGSFGSAGIFFSINVTGGVTELTASLGVRITDNVLRPVDGRGIVVFNASDIVIENNTIIGGKTSLIGYTPTDYNVLYCTVKNNTFSEVQPTEGYALNVYKCSKVTFDGNIFKNCGNVAGPGNGGAINFTGVADTSSYITFVNNTFADPANVMVNAIYKDSGHTFTPTTNTFVDNVITTAATNAFTVTAAIPASGGNKFTNVGIGTAPVTYPLEVNTGAQNCAGFRSNSGNVQITATDGTVSQAVGYAATSFAYSGTLSAHGYALLTNNTARVEIAATTGNFLVNTGNVGIGYGPNAWNSSSKALQLNNWASLATDASNRPIWLNNAFLNAAGSYEYINAGPALRIRLKPDTTGGNLTSQIEFATAASGSAGGTASFSTRFFVDADGRGCLGGNTTVTDAWAKWRVGGTLPTSSSQSVASDARYIIPSGSTSLVLGYQSSASTEAASFTVATLKHFAAEQGTIGAGSAITTQIGFSVDNSVTGATNNWAFHGAIDAGSNRFNCYMVGTARNYFNGGVEVASGTTTMTRGFTHIPSAAGAPTGAPTNPSGNVPMYYDSTNHKIYVYSGGTWRSTAALT
jgi:hypothetical protein